MELNTENERKLYNIIVSIAEEINMKKNHVSNLGPYEIQSLIIKDIHIARILREANEKSRKALERELRTLKQQTFAFASHLQRYA